MRANDFLERLSGYDFNNKEHLPLIIGDIHDLQVSLVKQFNDEEVINLLISLTEHPFIDELKSMTMSKH